MSSYTLNGSIYRSLPRIVKPKISNFCQLTPNFKDLRLYHSGIADCADDKINNPSEPIDSDKDISFMRLALRHAQHAYREKEVPIGCVIVDGNGFVVSSSRNRVESTTDASAHAELECLKKASKLRNNWRLSDCTLYSTLEPCPMCLGAIYSFRVKRVVYGANDIRLGACGSFINLPEQKHPFHTLEIKGGVLAEESTTLLKQFFQNRRKESTSRASNEKDLVRGNIFINDLK
eukprot:gene5878-8105_t